MEGRLKMKFAINDKIKQIIDESGDYVFEKRTENTWWFELMYIEDLVRVIKNTKKILSIELDEYEYGDLFTIHLFDGYKEML